MNSMLIDGCELLLRHPEFYYKMIDKFAKTTHYICNLMQNLLNDVCIYYNKYMLDETEEYLYIKLYVMKDSIYINTDLTQLRRTLFELCVNFIQVYQYKDSTQQPQQPSVTLFNSEVLDDATIDVIKRETIELKRNINKLKVSYMGENVEEYSKYEYLKSFIPNVITCLKNLYIEVETTNIDINNGKCFINPAIELSEDNVEINDNSLLNTNEIIISYGDITDEYMIAYMQLEKPYLYH